MNIKPLLLLTLALFSTSLFAEPRIAQSPEDIKPLLNGMSAPLVSVQDSEGKAVELGAVLKQQDTVLVFYRGGWCPYCNLQLAALREIEPKLKALGYQLIAVTPDSPAAIQASLKDTKGAAITYTLLSDSQFKLSSAFGVAYYLDEKTSATYLNTYKLNLNKEQSTGKVVLPVPAVYILNKEGLVQYSYQHINYKVRLQPELLLLAARLAKEPNE
jgi:peroxiredoxin